MSFLTEQLEVIDNRSSGGALWVVGDRVIFYYAHAADDRYHIPLPLPQPVAKRQRRERDGI